MFKLSARTLSVFKGHHLWIALLSFGCVLLAGIVDLGRPSPGPLSAVHARIDDLAGRLGCAGCHGGWGGNMTESCLECHAEVEAQVADGTGVHGVVGEERARVCALCHSDHHGPDFAMVNPQSFFQAGLGDPAEFDHGVIGFEMTGEHLEQDCVDCHLLADEPVLPENGRRYAGLDQDCASCHEDPHAAAMSPACVDCHLQTGFDELRAVGHEQQLPLVGGHGALDCRTCHALDDPHALEFQGDRDAPAARACVGCHDSPHSAGFSAGTAELADLARSGACVVCHAEEHVSFREPGLTITDEEHATSGFALDAPHAELTCEACHEPVADDFGERYPGRERDACQACHADAHAGQFETGPFAGRGCIACHEEESFEPHTFDAEHHALAFLALDEAHGEEDCSACHAEPHGDAPRIFRGIPNRCQDCHDDAHAGFFDPRLAERGAPVQGSCAECHGASSFGTLAVSETGGFDHGAWTGFELHGAHDQNGCESCHLRAHEPDSAGRTFGRVQEHFGGMVLERTAAVELCADCHADPHGGEFDDVRLSAEVDGREGCARCHEATSFRAFPRGFDHGEWTGFPLEGPHLEASCSVCHAPIALGKPGAQESNGRTPDFITGERSWERAIGNTCEDCHADPHLGQFREEGATDCSQCHATAGHFQLVFDHDRDSSFPLEGRHAELDCGACHRPWELEGGGSVTRYQPLGTKCDNCHAVQQPELLRKRGRK